MTAFAQAIRLSDSLSSGQSLIASDDAGGASDIGYPIAASRLSLAVMRDAFEGLLVVPATSISPQTEERDVLELPLERVPHSRDNPSAFSEEAYSFEAVRESDDIFIAQRLLEIEGDSSDKPTRVGAPGPGTPSP